jgi:hypothetical protein
VRNDCWLRRPVQAEEYLRKTRSHARNEWRFLKIPDRMQGWFYFYLYTGFRFSRDTWQHRHAIWQKKNESSATAGSGMRARQLQVWEKD